MELWHFKECGLFAHENSDLLFFTIFVVLELVDIEASFPPKKVCFLSQQMVLVSNNTK